jgi:hypothetical protein
MGRVWVHAALAVVSRFVIELCVGPRTLESAKYLVGSVAMCCTGAPLPLLLIDDHRPYPAAILDVFGVVGHRRRRHRRGRKKHPTLKAPPGLLVGIVHKLRDATGNLLGVKTRALFGRLKEIRQRIAALGIGHQINTSHLERLNGTMRGQQTRLARRTRNGSRGERWLQWALWLWRDLYNWVHPHRSLEGRTPAMALGLSDRVWLVLDYIRHPVHVSELKREEWSDQRKTVQESALDRYFRKKPLPTS